LLATRAAIMIIVMQCSSLDLARASIHRSQPDTIHPMPSSSLPSPLLVLNTKNQTEAFHEGFT
jgi:hypothetical protein